MKLLIVGAALIVSGCASVSAIPLSQDSFQLVTNASQECGAQGAQRVAYQQAAAETIRKGYDRFIISQAQRGSQIETASISGGILGYNRSYGQDLNVQMFKEGDPLGANAISARESLGPKWQELVATKASYGCW
ncbi:MAG: hypothetical protein WC807_21220 [Hyphomicrobium sp.]|jgi:hypothetical protein